MDPNAICSKEFQRWKGIVYRTYSLNENWFTGGFNTRDAYDQFLACLGRQLRLSEGAISRSTLFYPADVDCDFVVMIVDVKAGRGMLWRLENHWYRRPLATDVAVIG